MLVQIIRYELTGGRVTVTGDVTTATGTTTRVTIQQWKSYLDEELPNLDAKKAFIRAQLKAEYLGQAAQVQLALVDPTPIET